MRSNLITSCVCILMLFGYLTTTDACTVFRLQAKDGSILVTRSMEFAINLNYQTVVVPRNTPFSSPFKNGVNGLKWNTRYGYVAITAEGLTYGASDGMNEKGLAIGVLWFENDMTWQTVTLADSNIALAQAMFSDWTLGNFATAEEVRDALPSVKVFDYEDPTSKMAPTVHFIVYDASGGCIVIEYNFGTCNVYENPLGVMTNAPRFPYHMTNLRNFIGLTTGNPPSRIEAGLTFPPTGHGVGFWGLPGDYTPPSRFIRLGILTGVVDQQPDVMLTLNLGQHVINTFDIPFGVITEPGENNTVNKESTQWVTFRDLTNRILYFRTYDNFTLRKIDLNEIDLSKPGIKIYNMFDTQQTVVDITEKGVAAK
ncbi:MAG: linear amide C-N hydrolase [Bacteroidales bacterium]|nr:linear amide C-N hydrolase [Bacteroidales bacterium]